MKTKTIQKFMEDIETEKVKNWDIEEGCHPDIKKITLNKEGALTEKEKTQEIQIKLENNPEYLPGAPNTGTSSKQWILEEDIPVETVSNISSKLNYPVKKQ